MADPALNLGELQKLLDDAAGKEIACAGDLMLDRYDYGEVSRFSPEAPIPVRRTTRTVAMPGGVGNVARNVAALGGVARLHVAGYSGHATPLEEGGRRYFQDYLSRPDHYR